MTIDHNSLIKPDNNIYIIWLGTIIILVYGQFNQIPFVNIINHNGIL